MKNCTGTLLLALGAATAGAQQAPAPSLTSEVAVVRVNVSVDATDTAASGIRAEDFVLLEDGVPQDVTFFEHRDTPLEVMLLLDMSDSMAARAEVAKRAARRLVEGLRPQDTAELAVFSTHPRVLQSTTADRAALMAAIDRATPDGETSLHNVLYVTLKDLARASRAPATPHRRAVILLSDGQDTSSVITDDQVLEEARRSDVAIYSVVLRGPMRASEEQRRRAEYLLTTLAGETGGRVFLPAEAEQPDRIFEQVVHDLQNQFSLGYVPKNPRRDGRWRQILVSLRAASRLQLRHRLGYYAKPD